MDSIDQVLFSHIHLSLVSFLTYLALHVINICVQVSSKLRGSKMFQATVTESEVLSNFSLMVSRQRL